MNCEKCGKPIPAGIDYCPSCKLAENPNYIKYQEERNNKEGNPNNNIEIKTPISTFSSTEEKKEIITEQEKSTEVIVKCQCGQKLEAGWKSCPQCNTPINVEIATSNTNESTPLKKENSTIYITIFLACLALGYFLQGIFYMVALITIITGKIKCPNSRAIKVLFWLSILAIVIYAVLIVWLIISCGMALPSCVDEMRRCG